MAALLLDTFRYLFDLLINKLIELDEDIVFNFINNIYLNPSGYFDLNSKNFSNHLHNNNTFSEFRSLELVKMICNNLNIKEYNND